MIGVMDIVPASVLVIESHPLMRDALCNAIAEEPDLQAAAADTNGLLSSTASIMDDVFFLPHKLDLTLWSLDNLGPNELAALKVLHASLPDVPILVLIGDEAVGQERAALEAGAQAVLTKAASRSEIINTLRELHGKNTMSHDQVFLE